LLKFRRDIFDNYYAQRIGPESFLQSGKRDVPWGVGQQIVPESVDNGVLPFFKSSRLTVTAVKDIATG
jgi:hypothetical protein